MKLKRTNKYNNTIYFIILKINGNDYILTLDDQDNLYVDGENYKILGQNELN